MKYAPAWQELRERIEMFQALNYTPEYKLVLETMDKLEDEYE